MDIQDHIKTGDTKLIESEAISEDEHHSDEDKDKTPSPKIQKGIIKESGNSAGGTEDDLFSDAVTEFSDSGISPGATKLLDSSPLEVSKVDDYLEVFETPDTHTKDADETEENDINIVRNSVDTKIKLLDSDMKPSDDPLVEDKDGDKLIDLKMKPDSVNAMDVSSKNVDSFEVSDKDQEGKAVYVLSVPNDIPLVDHSEALIDDFKDHETIYSNVPMVLDHDAFEFKTAESKIQESQPSENGESSTKSSIFEHTNTGSSTLVPKDVIEEVKESETKPSEVVKETKISDSDPVLTEKDPAWERLLEAYTQEIVKEPESGFEAEQKIVGSVGVDSKERGNLGISQRSEKVMAEKDEQDEGDGKLMTNQDSVGSSSRNSLEGNWGSVSVLSTASIDVENAHAISKSESRLGKSDGFHGQSLVQLKEEISSEIQNSEPPKSEAKIVNESEGRKRNQEAIAKVTNWSTSENSTTNTTPLKNVAKFSNPKELSKNVIRKDEVVEKSSREAEIPSPPKYIGDGKKVRNRKKGKGRGSWIPFGCCSSVNVN